MDILGQDSPFPYDGKPVIRDSRAAAKSPFTNIMVVFAVAVFVLNIFLVGFIFIRLKKEVKKDFSVNYYSLSVGSEQASAFGAQKAINCSVCVAAGGKAKSSESFFEEMASRGSGVVLLSRESSVYIVTCYHVVAGYEREIYVMFPSVVAPIKSTFIGFSEEYDIAVLKAVAPANLYYETVTVRPTQLTSIGERAIAVGNSLSSGITVTSGVISKVNKMVLVEGSYLREIQTDAPINPGNSGGGLFSATGELLGLVNAKLCTAVSGGTQINVEGTAFALPGSFAMGLAESIVRNNGQATFVDIGIDFEQKETFSSNLLIDGNIAQDYEVYAANVSPNGVCSGKVGVGDTILSFSFEDNDGDWHEVYISNKYCFEDNKFGIRKNSVMKLDIIRFLSGERETVTVTLTDETVQN